MSRLVWVVGWVAVGIWSLVCAAAYGIFDIVGRLFMRNADAFSSNPETVEGIWRFLSFLHNLSVGAIGIGWAVVSLLILAVPWLFDRMMSAPASPAATAYGRMRYGRRDEGVIDLGPDQYSVGPTPDGRPTTPGPAPRISPRM